MNFGDIAQFGIEIGPLLQFPTVQGYFSHFRLWVQGKPIGDWDDLIPLNASVESASLFCAHAKSRQEAVFEYLPASEVFQKVYNGFFSHDCSSADLDTPYYRRRYHLDEIGLGSLQDKFGVVLVEVVSDRERLLVKDLRCNEFVIDAMFSTGVVDSALKSYVDWGRSTLVGHRADGWRGGMNL